MIEQNVDNVSLQILVEIVSCDVQPSEAHLESDPNKTFDVYCTCKQSSQKIHKTNHIRKTTEPIWTILTKSLFLLRTTSEKLKAGNNGSGGLTFEVLHDAGLLALGQQSSYFSFGSVVVPYEQIMSQIVSGNSERLEFQLTPSDFSNDYGITPSLYLRFCHATKEDEEFMNSLNCHFSMRKPNFCMVKSLKLARSDKSISHTSMKKDSDNIEMFLVKPYPDPNNVTTTK